MHIKKFTPPQFEKSELDMAFLNGVMNKELSYASMGRYALLHILSSMGCKGKIMLPAYICSSILEPIKRMNLEPVFYDIVLSDLNASIESINDLFQKTQARTLLIASMYGNPANLIEIEQYCRDHDIVLIDDAAQSFGAKLDNRMIGSFGNGGFFSFSPGKPTAGHMGAFFWSDHKEYSIERSSQPFYHKIAYYNYYFNRLNIYRYDRFKIFEVLKYFQYILLKNSNLSDDDICGFEKEVLGGILKSLFSGEYDYRNKYCEQFVSRYEGNSDFTPIKAIRGKASNHKLVLRAHSPEKAQEIIALLKQNNIYSLNGYSLLSNSLEKLPNTKTINNCIVEIPIENDADKINYLFRILDFKK